MARHLTAAKIFGIVNFYNCAGRSIAAEQFHHARLVLGASFTLGLVVQDHDAHRSASIEKRSY
jgi:hypothetical protein